MQKPLAETIREMRGLGQMLIPYSFPLVNHVDEAAIACLKQREITLDGYEIGVYYNTCDYGQYKLESVQVFGKHFTFLPFYLVCKVARTFLGEVKLALIESIHIPQITDASRKIYVWTLYYDRDGRRVDNPFIEKSTPDTFDGLKFNRIQEKDIKFF